VLHVLGRRNRISLGSVDDLAFLQVRQMDSLQLARNHNVATPANWAHGKNIHEISLAVTYWNIPVCMFMESMYKESINSGVLATIWIAYMLGS
jgi:hypothetical protein